MKNVGKRAKNDEKLQANGENRISIKMGQKMLKIYKKNGKEILKI